MKTTNAHDVAGRPGLRPALSLAKARRESALRLVRDERRRLDGRPQGRFDYLKRAYD